MKRQYRERRTLTKGGSKREYWWRRKDGGPTVAVRGRHGGSNGGEREREKRLIFLKKGWNRSIKGEVVTEQKTKKEKWSLLLNVKGV